MCKIECFEPPQTRVGITDGAASGRASLWDSCFSNAKHDRVFHLERVGLAAFCLLCELRDNSEITTVGVWRKLTLSKIDWR